MGNLVEGYTKTYEVNVGKPTLGDRLWHLENNKPDIGVNFSVIDYGNPKELGYALIVAPFVEIPLNKKEKTSRMIMRLCWGPAIVTKHFDLESNQKDEAIGSTLNAHIHFKWFWQIPINKNMRFEPGFMFSHVSNGRYQTPNLGLNVFSVGAALHFKLTDKHKEVTHIDSSTRAKSRHELAILNSYGANVGEIEGVKYLTSCLSFLYNYNKRNTHKFGVGFDVFYEQNYVKDLENAGVDVNSAFDKLRYGPKLSYSYNIGRISLPVEMGVYLRQLSNPDGWIYHKLGIRYYGDKGLILSFGLRSHWAVAYCFDYGIGYRIPFKKK